MIGSAYSFHTQFNREETDILINEFGKIHKLNISNCFYEQRKNIDILNPLLNIIDNNLQVEDILVVYDAMDLGRSTLEVTEVFDKILEKNIKLYIVKYNDIFIPNIECSTKSLLKLLQQVESEFEILRMTDRVGRRRHMTKPLGRPKGRKNKELKLDKHEDDIKKYLDLKISKASIAKLIGCHAQTLYNYIESKDLSNKVEETV